MPRKRSSRRKQRSDVALLLAVRILVPLTAVLIVGSWFLLRSQSGQRCVEYCTSHQLVFSDFSADDPMTAFTDGRCICAADRTQHEDLEFPTNLKTNPLGHDIR